MGDRSIVPPIGGMMPRNRFRYGSQMVASGLTSAAGGFGNHVRMRRPISIALKMLRKLLTELVKTSSPTESPGMIAAKHPREQSILSTGGPCRVMRSGAGLTARSTACSARNLRSARARAAGDSLTASMSFRSGGSGGRPCTMATTCVFFTDNNLPLSHCLCVWCVCVMFSHVDVGVVEVGGFDHAGDGGEPLLLLLLPEMLLLGEELAVVGGAKLFGADEKVAEVALELGVVLLELDHAEDELVDVARGHVREGGGEEARRVRADKGGVVRKGGGAELGHVPERHLELVHLGDGEEVLQDERVELEAGLVEGVRHDGKNLLEQHEVVGLIKLVRKLALLERHEELEEEVEPRLGDVALGVAEGPHDAVDHEAELLRVEREERAEGVVHHRPEQREELEAVVRVVLEVFGDHHERALKGGGEDDGHELEHRLLHLVDDGSEEREHLRLACVGHVERVVVQDRVDHRGDELLRHQERVLALFHKRLDEAERLALDGAQQLHHARLGRRLPALRHRLRDEARVVLVHLQHVGVDEAHLRLERLPERGAHRHVGLQDVGHLAHAVVLLEHLRVLRCLRNDGLPRRVGRLHQPHEVLLPPLRVCLAVDHVPDRLVKGVDLVRLEKLDGLLEPRQQLDDVRLRLAHLHDDEAAFALDANLQKCVARHVLHPRVRLVHKLEQLVHHHLEELPVQSQEARILPDDVHDVGRHDRLAVLPFRLFAEVEEVADDGDQKVVLLVLQHRAGDAPNRPAQRVKRGPRVILRDELRPELVEHLRRRIMVIQVREIDERLLHHLVLHQHVVVLHRLADDAPAVILHQNHLLRLGHARNHQHPELGHWRLIKHLARAAIRSRGLHPNAGRARKPRKL
mmetsp:Transcript_18416/g.59909  ORF Transcript_18416/g.59909 Transcript_18416/m.59909 type:complete len:862 (-) Transcript_18416:1209-3794(-)